MRPVRRTSTLLATGAAALAVVCGGTGIAFGGGAPDDDQTETPISGAALERASEAALAATGEGRVTATEVGDEEGFYEVEVTLDDGSQVDVHLDEHFVVLDRQGESGQTDDD